MLTRLFGTRATHSAAEALYGASVAQARLPIFYQAWQVPDTVDGRFEMVAFHVFLVLHRLKSAGPAAQPLAQALFDTMFADMDRSLREMGATDLGVGRRVKEMAKGFYGRIAAYEAGLGDSGPALLEEALRRNAYGTLKQTGQPSPQALSALALYMRACVAALAVQGENDLLSGKLGFAPVERPGERH